MKRGKIPNSEIQEGVKSCFKNSQRLWIDATILGSKEKYQSAIVTLLLAHEEFAKVVWLLSCWKNKKDISEKDVNKYFRDHVLRLEEFEKYLMNSLPSFSKPIPQDLVSAMARGKGKSLQKLKESMTYVDWYDGKWHNPVFSQRLIISDASDVENLMDLHYNVAKVNLNHAMKKLQEDKTFKKVMSIPDKIKPTYLMVTRILSSHFNQKKVPYTLNEIKAGMEIKLDSTNSLVNESLKYELKKKLVKKFPDSNFVIKLSKPPFSHWTNSIRL